jgi:16S rRNA (cytidine1402-2'-O)-methyltransferase
MPLYLIPNSLHLETKHIQIPEYERLRIQHLQHFVVENEKMARQGLKKLIPDIDQNALEFLVLEKENIDTDKKRITEFLKKHPDCGLLSDAGMPCIADPGSLVVAIAHSLNITVCPMIGGNSLLLALAASGFNGQNFAFYGYLPIDEKEKAKKLKQLEDWSAHNKQTQLFIETPYRNIKMIESMLQHLQPNTRICFAMNLSTEKEFIVSCKVKEWKTPDIEIHKQPAVFLLYAGN